MLSLLKKTLFLLGVVLSAAAFGEGDPAGFVHRTPDQIKWAASAAIPPGGQGTVVYGNPRNAAPYITRVRLPADYKIAPHRHPEERVYTVISGVFYIGFGDDFDPAKLHAFPAGSVLVVPANANHFHWMRSGEAIVQISGTGPSGIAYVDPADDPRHRNRD